MAQPDDSELYEIKPVAERWWVVDHARHDIVILESDHVDVESELLGSDNEVEEYVSLRDAVAILACRDAT